MPPRRLCCAGAGQGAPARVNSTTPTHLQAGDALPLSLQLSRHLLIAIIHHRPLRRRLRLLPLQTVSGREAGKPRMLHVSAPEQSLVFALLLMITPEQPSGGLACRCTTGAAAMPQCPPPGLRCAPAPPAAAQTAAGSGSWHAPAPLSRRGPPSAARVKVRQVVRCGSQAWPLPAGRQAGIPGIHTPQSSTCRRHKKLATCQCSSPHAPPGPRCGCAQPAAP